MCPEGPNESKNPHFECQNNDLYSDTAFNCLNRADKEDQIFEQSLFEAKKRNGLNLNDVLSYDQNGINCGKGGIVNDESVLKGGATCELKNGKVISIDKLWEALARDHGFKGRNYFNLDGSR